MVFAPTNSVDTNFSTEVHFSTGNGDTGHGAISGRYRAMVRFSTSDYDIVLQRSITNSVYVIDDTATVTNITLQRNGLTPTTRRPSSLAVVRGQPYDWNSGNYIFTNGTYVFTPITNNFPWTNTLVVNPSYRSNQVEVMYAGYGAQIGDELVGTISTINSLFLTTGVTTDPTNMPGRVEIVGGRVNLDQTRIRSESLLSIKTSNLTSNRVAQVDAPYLIYDLASVEPTLVISNLAPATVRRLSGEVNAWSGVWTNIADFVSTNGVGTNATPTTNSIEIAFHALVVENALTTIRPTVVYDFAAHATNLVIGDTLSIGNTVYLEATNLDVQGALIFPANTNWNQTDVPNLVNLTNEGYIGITGAGYFGAEPASPYQNFVNHGQINGATHVIRTEYFENHGSPNLASSGQINANSGLLSLETQNGDLTNAQMVASGDIQIFADNLTNQFTRYQAGVSNALGALIMSVTNRLTDGGTNANNEWTVTSGFHFDRKPQFGDLLGTRLQSIIPGLSGRADHTWAGEDRGPNNQGYANNLALGRLTLDGTPGSLFVFSPATTNNALYVDYLELLDNPTNYNAALRIDPGMKIYFANANLPVEKLNSHNSGRLIWISSYTGMNSSTNITYPSGVTYGPFNTALASSKDIDSDGDGYANANDATPFIVPEDLGLVIELVPAPSGTARLSWNPLISASNIVEYKDDLSSPSWQVLTNFVSDASGNPVTITDAVPPGSSRFYRVRIQQP